MKIGFMSADWSQSIREHKGHPAPGGACWYRVVMPARELAHHGISVVVGQYIEQNNGAIFPIDMDGNAHDDCDVVVFQRWMDQDARRVFREARAAGQFIINDVDDWFFGMPQTNSAFKGSHPKENPTANVDHYRKALGASDLITVSTPYLAERLQRLGVPVVVIRNAVDLSAFTSLPFVAEKPVIGWTGSTQHRSGDLETLRGVLWPFMERHDLRAFHGGARLDAMSFAEGVGIPSEQWDRVSEVSLLPMSRYPEFFAQFDLGIVPLSNHPFNEAKSSIKGMEYAAAGIPFVAQATSEYRWFNQGVVCRRPLDWVRALERLLEPSERTLLRTTALERVKHEDITVRWTDWEEVYRTVMRR